MRIQDQFDIVLFDGLCNLCNNAVDFIIKRDKNNSFKLGALQDQSLKKLLNSYRIKEDFLDSLILIRRGKVYYKSRAALEIAKKLTGLWPLLYGFIIFPAFLRDPVYDWIANNRYKWFGKKESCRIPTKEELEKFL